MKEITIETSPFSVTEYFWGWYGDHRFSLMVDPDNGYNVEWVDATPDNSEEIEQEIIKHYESK